MIDTGPNNNFDLTMTEQTDVISKQPKIFYNDLVRLIDTKIVKSLETENIFYNKFWIKDREDEKPYFKYEESAQNKQQKKFNFNSTNKSSKRASMPSNLPSRLETLGIKKELSNNKKAIRNNINTLISQRERKPIIDIASHTTNKMKESAVKAKLNKEDKIIGSVTRSSYQQVITKRKVHFNNETNKNVQKPSCNSAILHNKQNKVRYSNFYVIEKKATVDTKINIQTFPYFSKKCNCGSNCILLPFQKKPKYSCNVTDKTTDNCEQIQNEKSIVKNDVNSINDLSVKKTVNDHHDYDLEEFLRFEYYSTLSTNVCLDINKKDTINKVCSLIINVFQFNLKKISILGSSFIVAKESDSSKLFYNFNNFNSSYISIIQFSFNF